MRRFRGLNGSHHGVAILLSAILSRRHRRFASFDTRQGLGTFLSLDLDDNSVGIGQLKNAVLSHVGCIEHCSHNVGAELPHPNLPQKPIVYFDGFLAVHGEAGAENVYIDARWQSLRWIGGQPMHFVTDLTRDIQHHPSRILRRQKLNATHHGFLRNR